MKINKTKNAIKNITFGYANKILVMLLAFVTRTVIIKTLCVDYIGLNTLYSSVLVILSLAELGFGTAMAYSMYKPIADDNQAAINALLNLYKRIYRIVGVVVLIVGLAVMPALPHLIKGGYPADINIYTLYLVFLANNVVGYFFFAYRQSLLTAHQRNDVLSKIGIATSVFMNAMQIGALLLFKNYYVYVIFMPITTLLNNIIIAIVTKKMYPQYKCTGQVDNDVKKGISKQIYALFLHRIGYVIQASIDSICISAFMGLALLGKYNNYFYIITAIEAFITIIKQSYLAGIGNCLIVESKEYNKRLFYKFFIGMCWIVGWCAVCLTCLYQPFMTLWVKQDNMLSFSMVLCLVALFVVGGNRGVIGMYKDALGMWYQDRFKPMSISIVNLVLTLISAYYGSLEGIVLATVTAYLFVGMPWETLVFFKHYMKEKPWKYFLKFIYYLSVDAIAISLTYLLCSVIPLSGVAELVAKAAICIVVPNIIFVLMLFKLPEFKDLFKGEYGIMNRIRKIFRKGCSFIKKCVKNSISLLFYFCPVKKNRICVYNFMGNGYGDNPKYLVEELLKRGKYEIVWIVKDLNTYMPEGIKKVKYGSLKSIYYMTTSRLWLDTIRNNPKPLFKRKGQYYIQMWHGSLGVKGVEKDVEEYLSKDYIKNAKKDSKYADFMLSNGKFRTELIKRAFWFNGNILELGFPRDDVLFKPDTNEVNKLKERHSIKNKKIILYAPTFRNNREFYNGIKFDYKKLVDVLNKKFKDDFVFCIRLHPNDIDIKNIDVFKDAIDLTVESDPQLVLSASDVVISDYSSMVIDFILTGKYSFIFAPDYDEYIKKERHLYMDIKECGIPFANNFEELLDNVKNLNEVEYHRKIEKLISFYGIIEDGNSAKLIVKKLVKEKILKE